MLNWLRAVARFFQDTIGWNRIGVVLSLTIIGIAVVVLYHMLRDIRVDEVLHALKRTRPHQIAAAAVFVTGAYFTLTFYDWFALRTIGRGEIPYRIAALSGFTSYAVGHNSAPLSSPVALCAIASIRSTDLTPSRWPRFASSPG